VVLLQSNSGVGRIAAVIPSSVVVEWVSGRDPDQMQDSVCDPSTLTLLNFYEHTRYQIGDHVLLEPSAKLHYLTIAKATLPSSISTSATTTSASSSESKVEEKASSEGSAPSTPSIAATPLEEKDDDNDDTSAPSTTSTSGRSKKGRSSKTDSPAKRHGSKVTSTPPKKGSVPKVTSMDTCAIIKRTHTVVDVVCLFDFLAALSSLSI
jgi:hypothetical protein